MNAFPEKLEEIIELFEHLPETERREMLISFSENTRQHEPREGETFDLEDVRKDDECTDEVGVFLNIDDQGANAHSRHDSYSLPRTRRLQPSSPAGSAPRLRTTYRRQRTGPPAQPNGLLCPHEDEKCLRRVSEARARCDLG
jgi:hypothetical protein